MPCQDWLGCDGAQNLSVDLTASGRGKLGPNARSICDGVSTITVNRHKGPDPKLFENEQVRARILVHWCPGWRC